MELYHGSTQILAKPTIDGGRADNDYGKGFYCTQSVPLAMEWACKESTRDAFINKYYLDTEGLKICNLSGPGFNVLNWIALLMNNRNVNLKSTSAEEFSAYILDNFLPDISRYDAIAGYRADDSYFSIARSFLENSISVRQLGKALKLGKLGEQFVLKSEKAFERILYLGYMKVPYDEYHAKRIQRDRQARYAFLDLETELDKDLFMIDIIRGKIKNDDPRLR